MPRFPRGTILFEKYRVDALLGKGGFAEVYLVTHQHLRTLRALKVLTRSGGVTTGALHQAAERFRLEARLGARFAEERHIVRVYDFEEDRQAGLLGLVMEYLPGGTLKKRLRKAREQGLPGLAVDFVIRTAYHAALGLAALHRAELVHRDIKPANILYDAKGNAKIADLGVAQIEHGITRRSELGDTAPRHPGTPEYMSPEQAAHVAYLSPSSDIYSLGVVLFEALTSKRYKHVRPGTRASRFRPDIPAWLDDLLARMLAEDPKARPWDGAELATLISSRLREPRTAPTTTEKALATTLDETWERDRTEIATEYDSKTYDAGLSAVGPPRAAPPSGPPPAGRPRPPRGPSPGPWHRGPTPPPASPGKARAPSRTKMGLGIALGMALLIVLLGGWLFTRRAASSAATVSAKTSDSTEPTASSTTPFPTSASASVPSATAVRLLQATATQRLPTATLWPTPTSRPEQKVNPIDGAVMRYIPAGYFTLGLTGEQVERLLPHCEDSSGCRDLLYASTPSHRAWVDAFWIYQTEVSNEMYRQCVEDGACSPPRRSSSETRSNYYRNPTYAHFPVTMVSWYQARAYCQWAGGRLPTNAEWEYAARGADGRLFPWGNTFPTADRANVDNVYGDTVAVDEFASYASPFGVLNMTGNVWEWVEDWWSASYYRENQDWKNPKGPSQGDLIQGRPVRAGRGGNYWIRGVLGSVAVWDWDHPDAAGWGDGIRCVVPAGHD